MIFLQLLYEFLKIGLFSFGGGYATLPFLYYISQNYGWYTLEELTQMCAVASITPGPIGINMATYAGLKTGGFCGALVATISIMLPSLVLVIIVAKLLKKFNDNKFVKFIIQTLKPIGCALLTAVAIGLVKSIIDDYKAIILLIVLLLLSWKTKKDPLYYIFISSLIGILFKFVTL